MGMEARCPGAYKCHAWAAERAHTCCQRLVSGELVVGVGVQGCPASLGAVAQALMAADGAMHLLKLQAAPLPAGPDTSRLLRCWIFLLKCCVSCAFTACAACNASNAAASAT
jgi:hypothetical protein